MALGLAAVCGLQGYGQTLGDTIGALLASPAVARDHWGIDVETMDGTPIFTLNDAQLFQPASTAKLFTTTAAVQLLGGGRRFTTAIEGPAGSRVQAVLEGDLTLRGAGEGALAGREVPYVEPADKRARASTAPARLHDLEEMADGVAAAGVKHITGDVVGDDTLFPWEPYPQDWAADDLVWGYGAPVSALSVNDNTMRLVVTPAKPGEPATVTLEPAVPYYELRASVTTTARKAESSVQVDRAPGSRVLRVWGKIAADSGADLEEVAIDDPAEFAARALKQMLEARGIHVDGRARAEHRISTEPRSFRTQAAEPVHLPEAATRLTGGPTTSSSSESLHVEHTSPTLIEDVIATNKDSLNLHAELMLRQLGKAYGDDGSSAQGVRVVRAFLERAGIDKDDFAFFDGSGLSGHDLVTPRAMARVLRYAATQPWFMEWRGSLPIGGVDGTLEHRFAKSALKGRVFAKTGTLGEARALGGYVECASGKTVIFSIMVGSHLPGTSVDRETTDKIVEAIAAAN